MEFALSVMSLGVFRKARLVLTGPWWLEVAGEQGLPLLDSNSFGQVFPVMGSCGIHQHWENILVSHLPPRKMPSMPDLLTRQFLGRCFIFTLISRAQETQTLGLKSCPE